MIQKGAVIQASDKNYYRFEGAQWKLYNKESGKASRIATWKISFELERRAVELGLVTAKSFFGQVYISANRKKLTNLYSAESRNWLKGLGENTKRVSRVDILSENKRAKADIQIGGLYFYQYIAKGYEEKTLKYWDAFPCVFPFEFTNDGFYGLNLHYLPIDYRAQLFDALFNTVNDKKYDDNTRLKLNYNILKGFSEFNLIKPTIHRYLYEKVESKFIKIEMPMWAYALFLPVQNFRDGKTGRVYDLRKIYKDSAIRGKF